MKRLLDKLLAAPHLFAKGMVLWCVLPVDLLQGFHSGGQRAVNAVVVHGITSLQLHDALESRPAKRWEGLVEKSIWAVCAAVIALPGAQFAFPVNFSHCNHPSVSWFRSAQFSDTSALLDKLLAAPHLFAKGMVLWCVACGTAASAYAMRILSRTGQDTRPASNTAALFITAALVPCTFSTASWTPSTAFFTPSASTLPSVMM